MTRKLISVTHPIKFGTCVYCSVSRQLAKSNLALKCPNRTHTTQGTIHRIIEQWSALFGRETLVDSHRPAQKREIHVKKKGVNKKEVETRFLSSVNPNIYVQNINNIFIS